MMESGSKEAEDQESNHVLRHHCKICNKGFGCAGALGGHMRTHVMGGDGSSSNNINNNNNNVVDDNIKPEGNKHSYFLRAKAPRYMNDQDTGQEYKKTSSPSSVIRFSSEKERLMSPPLPPSSGSRPHEVMSLTSREEEDLANCLVMLSNKSCHSNGNKEENKGKEVVERGLFQCKACKKVFTSHQALGGHRASHKKVKGCFAAKVDDHGLNDIDDNADEDSSVQDEHDRVETLDADTNTRSITTVSTRKRPHKMHECSVCRRVFSSGQALGGHKRCHWLTTSTDNAFIPSFHEIQYNHQNHLQQQELYKKPVSTTNPSQHNRCDDNQIDLNLNLHAPRLGENASKCEAPTTLYLQQLAASAGKIGSKHDERGCEVKLRKLSDLRDVNLDGGWLQMGIASTSDLC